MKILMRTRSETGNHFMKKMINKINIVKMTKDMNDVKNDAPIDLRKRQLIPICADSPGKSNP